MVAGSDLRVVGDSFVNSSSGVSAAGDIDISVSRFENVGAQVGDYSVCLLYTSRAGNATQGEWTGQTGPVANTARDVQALLIDSRDGQAQ